MRMSVSSKLGAPALPCARERTPFVALLLGCSGTLLDVAAPVLERRWRFAAGTSLWGASAKAHHACERWTHEVDVGAMAGGTSGRGGAAGM